VNHKHNQTTTLELDRRLIVGILGDLQATPDLRLGGESFTTEALAALVQSRIDAAREVLGARARLHGAVRSYAAIDARLRPVVADLRALVFALFGPKSVEVARFGFTPPKARQKLTPAQNAARAAKCRATRLARGTLGKRQRAALNGK
jgi:hypothetical protein